VDIIHNVLKSIGGFLLTKQALGARTKYLWRHVPCSWR